ncbi:MAG: hypothetical protein QM528_01795 [Phycisphaerales bacterium]|nr:hypothetical protein [Phycisphaerales bacterium]
MKKSNNLNCIVLISPTNNSINQYVQPIFVWTNSIASVKQFKIYYGDSPTHLLIDTINYRNPTRLTDTIRLDNGIGTAYLNYNTRYYWKVEGFDATGGLIYTTPTQSFSIRDSINMLTKRYYSGGTLYNGKIYIAGGSDGVHILNTVEYFDGTRWQMAPAMTVPRYGFGLAVYNGYVYAVGGNGGRGSVPVNLDTVEYFDGYSWQFAPSTSVPRAVSGVATYHGNLYVIGGYTLPYVLTNTVAYFNGNNGWTEAVAMTNNYIGTFGVAVYEGRLYALGGYNNVVALRGVEYFNGSTWTTTDSMNVARYAFGTVVCNGNIYVFGGSNGSTAVDSVEYFNGISWGIATPMPTARTALVASLYNDKIYVMGGERNARATVFSIVEIYNPLTNQWE